MSWLRWPWRRAPRAPERDVVAPYVDPECATSFNTISEQLFQGAWPDLDLGGLGFARDTNSPSLADVPGRSDLRHRQFEVPATDDDPALEVSIFTTRSELKQRPGLLFIHGGGMVIGNRFSNVELLFDAVRSFDAALVSIEYRLAPEHPHPAPIDDCVRAIRWIGSRAGELGLDPERLVLVGASAGGGLAAGSAIRLRDEGGPALAGQMLLFPMLDDANNSTSTRQVDGVGVWSRASNEFGWDALLGARRQTGEVPPDAAPARATDLSRLPPAYIEVGSADAFRTEDVAFAQRIWACGGNAELHVLPGGFHGSEAFGPDAAISVAARHARLAWLRRLL